MGEGWVRVFLLVQRKPDRVDHAIEIRDNLMVPDAQDAVIPGFKGRRAWRIFPFIMLATTQFDDQHRRDAQEIDYERSDAGLTPKFEAIQLTIAQNGP